MCVCRRYFIILHETVVLKIRNNHNSAWVLLRNDTVNIVTNTQQTAQFLLGAFAKLWKVTISFVMSVRMKQLDSHWTDFMKFDIPTFSKISLQKFKFH